MPTTITDNGVSSGARHLFHILKDRARGKNWPECWPHLWSLMEDSRKCRRTVLYYIRELERAGAIEVVREAGRGNRYRILLEVSERVGDLRAIAPVQPIAPLPVQPIAPLPVQPIAPVAVSHSIEEAIIQQAAQGTEVPAAAAEGNFKGEEMTTISKSTFNELVKMGMPSSAENEAKVSLQPDFAKDVLRHCKRRFGKGRKPVDNPGGYIAALLRDPGKFGWVKNDGIWCDPEKPSGPTQEEVSQRVAVNKEATRKLLSESQAAAEKAYAEMKDIWGRLPEEAKQEIRVFVAKEYPLFHGSGADAQEFELQCMKEASMIKRRNWVVKHLGQSLPKMAG